MSVMVGSLDFYPVSDGELVWILNRELMYDLSFKNNVDSCFGGWIGTYKSGGKEASYEAVALSRVEVMLCQRRW